VETKMFKPFTAVAVARIAGLVAPADTAADAGPHRFGLDACNYLLIAGELD
jgi:hypothetical protein